MNTRSNNASNRINSIPLKSSAPVFRWIVATGLLIVCGSAVVSAAPPSAEDDIDYAASGFQLPSGVNPSAWSTAAGVSRAGGMNYASQPAISGPMMGGPGMPMVGTPGMSGGMNGQPMMATPGIGGPMMGNSPMTQKIPASFPSGPIPGMQQGMQPGMPVSTGLPGPIGAAAYQAAMQSPYGQVMPINYQGEAGYPYEVYNGGSGGFYPGYACDCQACQACGACGDGSCDSGGFQGILPAIMGKCNSCNGQGCGICNSKMYQSGCLGRGGVLGDWCSGTCMEGDFGLMVRTAGGNLAAICDALQPYSEAGQCAQRWYDLSVEAMILGNNFSQGGMVLSTLGVGGPPALSLSDAKVGELTGGVRVSAAMIMGVGGNIEGTYIGGHEWDNSASVSTPNPVNPQLMSYISDFGTIPPGGLDDPDRSITHTASTDSVFHSGELNYRRRTVGPGCRFQGSWLVGLRYLRVDNGFNFDAVGTLNDGTGGFGGALNNELRFYNSDTNTKNNLFVGQIGYDLWWNMVPGVQVGFGMKGGWGQNDWERSLAITANSLGPGAVAGTALISDRDRLNTVMGEMETKMIYRFSHSWSLRLAHHVIAMDDILNSVPSSAFVRSALTDIQGGGLVTTSQPAQFSSVVLQGLSIGAEYIW